MRLHKISVDHLPCVIDSLIKEGPRKESVGKHIIEVRLAKDIDESFVTEPLDDEAWHWKYQIKDDYVYYLTKSRFVRSTKRKLQNFCGDKYFFEYLEKIDVETEATDINTAAGTLYALLSMQKSEGVLGLASQIVNSVVLEVGKHRSEILNGIAEVHTKKNHDYTTASSDPLRNFLSIIEYMIMPTLDRVEEFTIIRTGILWRIGDKVARIRTFNERKKLLVENDGYYDAVIDLISYVGLLYAFEKRW